MFATSWLESFEIAFHTRHHHGLPLTLPSDAGGSSAFDQVAFVRGFSEGVVDAWFRVKDDVGIIGWWCPIPAGKKSRKS